MSNPRGPVRRRRNPLELEWLDVAAAGGSDFTPQATADWRASVDRLPAALARDPRLDELHGVVDRWCERRGALRVDPLLDESRRAALLERLDGDAARSLEPFGELLHREPILLQLVYVLAKQTQEEARLRFLSRALVRYGERLADLDDGGDGERHGALRSRLHSTVGDLLQRYEGLALVAGELIHEGVERRRRQLARRSIDRSALDEVRELGRRRGLCDLDDDGDERGAQVKAEFAARLARPPFDSVQRRAAAREAYDAGRELGHELALDAFGRALVLLEALSRRVDLRRLARLREALEGADDRLRALAFAQLARQLRGGPVEAGENPIDVAREALRQVLPRSGPRRRLAECLLEGDVDGARAMRLLLELKGLPFNRGREIEALYTEAGQGGIERLEARFEIDCRGTARDARWLRVVKAGVRAVALMRQDLALAERLRPVVGELPLRELLERKLNPAERTALDRLRSGEGTESRLTVLQRAVDARDAAGVVAVLDGLDEPQREVLVARFAIAGDATLESRLAEGLRDSPLRDLALAMVRGQVRLARAARLRAALAEVGGVEIGDAFEGLSRFEREQLVEDYEHAYAGGGHDGARLRGVFEEDLRRLVGRDTAALVGDLVRHGGLPAEDLARYYMLGLGTNVDGLVGLLQPMDVEAIATVEERYDRKYRVYGARALVRELGPVRGPRAAAAERERFGLAARLVDWPLVGAAFRRLALVNGLRGDLATELSGDGWFDVRQAFGGRPDPEHPAALRERLAERRRHEFSGRLVRSERFFRRLRRSVDTVQRRADAAFPTDAVDGDPSVGSRARRLRYFLHARRALLALDRFRAAKNRAGAAIGDRLGGLGATVGGLGAAALERWMHGDASLFGLALGGTVGAFAGKVVPKKLIAGDALGTEEIGLDLAHALVEGAGRMFNRLRRFGRFAVDGVQRGVGRTVFKVGAKRTLDQVTRGLSSRLGARRDRLPELRVTSFRARDDYSPLSSGASHARSNVVGAELDHPADAGLEAVIDGLLREALWPR